MTGFALFLIMSAVWVLGFGSATVRYRANRHADALLIAPLRDALSDTQEQLTEAWFAKAEAVAAQEAAEEQLKQAHERKSLAGRRAWVTRKSNAEVPSAS